MGLGILHTKCSKHKLNVKRSTEVELVGASAYIPVNTWLYFFMTSQGYEIKDNVLYQDNQGTILMLKMVGTHALKTQDTSKLYFSL